MWKNQKDTGTVFPYSGYGTGDIEKYTKYEGISFDKALGLIKAGGSGTGAVLWALSFLAVFEAM